MNAEPLTPIERWQLHQDAAALREIMRNYTGMVYATACRVLGDRVEAEDVTQECFIALSQSRSVRADAVGAWLHAVATRRSLQRIRSTRRRLEREADFATHSRPHPDMYDDDLCRHVDEAIAELPDDLRTPLVAHYLEGRSHTAIARTLGVPRRTLSHRIARAVEHVGNTLRQRGVKGSSVALGVALQSLAAEARASGWHGNLAVRIPDWARATYEECIVAKAHTVREVRRAGRAVCWGRTAGRALIAAGISGALGVASVTMDSPAPGAALQAQNTSAVQRLQQEANADIEATTRETATPLGGGGSGGAASAQATSVTPEHEPFEDSRSDFSLESGSVPSVNARLSAQPSSAHHGPQIVRPGRAYELHHMSGGVYGHAAFRKPELARTDRMPVQRPDPVEPGLTPLVPGAYGLPGLFYSIDDRRVGEPPPSG